MIPEAVHRSIGSYLTAEENSKNLNYESMKTVGSVIASNGVSSSMKTSTNCYFNFH
jgi:hypothetical protein